ncbi:MAG: hypothetical protein CL489_06175 [Acidobacteria bacterium]|nr:hypothetical protein [Acidobacteriota bacterium]|tara:strand:+ start:27532 stop:28206 length:675 start_codon:yes stop_codon:yes gene_type:complete
MKKSIVLVAVGPMFQFYQQYTKRRFEAYADKIGAELIVLTGITQKWWGLEKYRVSKLELTGPTVYIDVDVLIQSWARDIFELYQPGKVGIYDDYPEAREAQPGNDWAPREWSEMMQYQHIDDPFRERLLNSGVVLFDKETQHIWNPPPFRFKPRHCAEQFWIDYQVGDNWFPLPREFNHQHWTKSFATSFHKSDFVHLSACKNREYWIAKYEHLLDRSQPYDNN